MQSSLPTGEVRESVREGDAGGGGGGWQKLQGHGD